MIIRPSTLPQRPHTESKRTFAPLAHPVDLLTARVFSGFLLIYPDHKGLDDPNGAHHDVVSAEEPRIRGVVI